MARVAAIGLGHRHTDDLVEGLAEAGQVCLATRGLRNFGSAIAINPGFGTKANISG
jgi:hypothetical protein